MSSSLQPHGLIQSTKFSRPGFWSGQPIPSPADRPDPGIDLGSPALQADSLPTELSGKPINLHRVVLMLPFFFSSVKLELLVDEVCSFSLGYEAIMNTEILYEVDKVVRANRHEIQGTIVSTGDCH